MVKTTRAKVLAVLVLVGFLNVFLFHRIGSVAMVLIFTAYVVFVAVIFGIKQKGIGVALGLELVVFSWVMLTVSNPLARTVAIFSMATLTTGAVYFLSLGKGSIKETQEMILVPINLGLAYARQMWEIGEELLSGRIFGQIPLKEGQLPVRKLVRVVTGICLAIPVAGLLLGLLSSGDPVFRYFLKGILSWQFWMRPTVHVIFSAVMLGIFLPLGLLKAKKHTEKYLPKGGAGGMEIGVMVVTVGLVLGTYLAVQWQYVFAKVTAETSLVKFGVATYSEYVNRGFGEFLLAAVIVYAVARAGIWAWQAAGKGWLRIVGCGLLAEFGMFLVSMMRRIYLYQQFHGWSLARIYGGIFVIWVGGMVIFLAGRFLSRRNLIVIEVVWTLMAAGAIGMFNAENFIITSGPPTVNGRVDYVYLARMSADGYAGWKMAYDYARTVVRGQEYPENLLINAEQRREIAYAGRIINELQWKQTRLKRQFESGDRWDKMLSWNNAEKRAYEKIQAEIPGGELDQLDKQAEALMERIYKQPEGENQFVMDVSYGSPFLE